MGDDVAVADGVAAGGGAAAGGDGAGGDALVVRTGVLRAVAADLAAAAYRLGHGLAGQPGLTVEQQAGWEAAVALAEVESATHDWLTGLGGAAADTAGLVRAAADGYDAADERAAGRLTRVG